MYRCTVMSSFTVVLLMCRATLIVPRHSAVACLNLDPRVRDVTSHYVVGEVRLQDVEVRIDGNLEERKKKHNRSNDSADGRETEADGNMNGTFRM